MVPKMYCIFLLFVSVFLASSAYKVSPPANFTWPTNSKKICFVGRFDLVLNVDYIQTSGEKVSVKVPLNNDTYESYRVSCSAPANIHELTVSMLDGFTEIILDFTVDSKNMTSLSRVYGYITFNDKQTYFKNYSAGLDGIHKFSSNESLFMNARGSSYRCNTKTVIQGFEKHQNVTVTSIDIENLRVEPFPDDTAEFSDYSVEKVCAADIAKNSNLIPIIVGACLAVLVIIVLVAYLIGRRRSRNGYQSV
ncbi:unnamed protein product [Rotaria socialis]|uniref:Lysosome-associated membrane glycoprotein 1 n=1 Tax=Rotaria socialis TaxID=392032 RepID=A0A818TZK0_9BILA|nr:unnamed protein product [Rotaria socialis]CAF3331879.1 unnamed protein product [Rotaria socialis]CAF3406437.1 unnamed protein product [Rotaria socialis]CAF3691008.1 unnamed protein product [Rotaria socialis]CAF3784493.1 unnamed protein product [Rotaria socialis]